VAGGGAPRRHEVPDLEALEDAIGALERDLAEGGPLHGHAQLRKFRARPGLDADVDARMACSPAFTGDEHPAFADYLVQCFVRTDLFGLLSSASTIELDFAFEPSSRRCRPTGEVQALFARTLSSSRRAPTVSVDRLFSRHAFGLRCRPPRRLGEHPTSPCSALVGVGIVGDPARRVEDHGCPPIRVVARRLGSPAALGSSPFAKRANASCTASATERRSESSRSGPIRTRMSSPCREAVVRVPRDRPGRLGEGHRR
jgi:hypothetical protein